MVFVLLASFVLSVQALKITAPTELKAKENFDDAVSADTRHTYIFVNEMDTKWMTTRGAASIVAEVTPSMLKSYIHEVPMQAKASYAGTVLIAAGLFAFMYKSHGVSGVLCILAFILSMSFMSISIKEIYVGQSFAFPQFVTACHQFITCLGTFTYLQYNQLTTGQKITYPTAKTVMQGLGPVAACTAMSLGFANLVLFYANVHFYEMFCPVNCVITFFLGIALGKPGDLRLLLPLSLMVVALAGVTTGEMTISWIAIAFQIAGILARAGKAQLQSFLLSGDMSQKFEPVELTCWMSSLTFLVMIVWSAINEGFAPYSKIMNLGVIGVTLLSSTLALILNTAAMFVMKAVGPVQAQLIGELKGIIATTGSIVAFEEVISIQQIVGYPLAIAAAFWYNHFDQRIKEEKAEKEKAEKEKSEKA